MCNKDTTLTAIAQEISKDLAVLSQEPGQRPIHCSLLCHNSHSLPGRWIYLRPALCTLCWLGSVVERVEDFSHLESSEKVSGVLELDLGRQVGVQHTRVRAAYGAWTWLTPTRMTVCFVVPTRTLLRGKGGHQMQSNPVPGKSDMWSSSVEPSSEPRFARSGGRIGFTCNWKFQGHCPPPDWSEQPGIYVLTSTRCFPYSSWATFFFLNSGAYLNLFLKTFYCGNPWKYIQKQNKEFRMYSFSPNN